MADLKHWADKPILRDLLWFLVLPHRAGQWLRQKGCSHRYDLADLVGRDAQGKVSCACYKCGKVSRADCGLNLPGSFDRYSTIPQYAGGSANAGVKEGGNG